MQDAITAILNRYDLTGRYLDKAAVTQLESFFSSGLDRIKIAEIINNQATNILKEASAQLYEEQPELLRPGGNSYTTRRYAACLRDIEYYLRYASYALIAGNNNILDQRVLNGLKDTYNSLSVPIAPTVRSIQLLQEIIEEELELQSINRKDIIQEPFQHLVNALSEQDL
uniref:allophycocyanin beta 18 subunit n=1 Tax=Bangia atropurpurea TaxID=31347 RepID=UPI0007C5F323|nr:allophycocyanin beta 18 subunit [Bangia atropurpurea]UNJ18237.1 allophycocyanin beta 18 subunit [Bangia atropurpurea]